MTKLKAEKLIDFLLHFCAFIHLSALLVYFFPATHPPFSRPSLPHSLPPSLPPLFCFIVCSLICLFLNALFTGRTFKVLVCSSRTYYPSYRLSVKRMLITCKTHDRKYPIEFNFNNTGSKHARSLKKETVTRRRFSRKGFR